MMEFIREHKLLGTGIYLLIVIGSTIGTWFASNWFFGKCISILGLDE